MSEILENDDNNLQNESAWSVIHEEVETYRGNVIWSVEKSKIFNIQNNVGKSLKSKNFDFGTKKVYTRVWIDLYPSGKEKKYGDFVSVYVSFSSCLKPTSSFKIKGMITLLSDCGEILESQTFPGDQVETEIIGFPEFVRKERLTKFLLGEDKLILQCRLKIESRLIDSICDKQTYTINTCTEPDDYRTCMLKDGSFADVKLRIGLEEIMAHKAILAARVPLLRILLKGADADEDTLEIRGMEMDILKEILCYIYTDQIPVFNYRLASKMYLAAHEHEIMDLAGVCSAYLGANLTMKNVFVTQALANKCLDNNLKAECINYTKTCDSGKLAEEAVIINI